MDFPGYAVGSPRADLPPPRELSSSGSPGAQCISLSIFKCPQGTEFLKSRFLNPPSALFSLPKGRLVGPLPTLPAVRGGRGRTRSTPGCSSPALEVTPPWPLRVPGRPRPKLRPPRRALSVAAINGEQPSHSFKLQ